jgi:hypothetical protein
MVKKLCYFLLCFCTFLVLSCTGCLLNSNTNPTPTLTPIPTLTPLNSATPTPTNSGDLTAGIVYTHNLGQISQLAVNDSGTIFTYWNNGLNKAIWQITPNGTQSVFATETQLISAVSDQGVSSLHVTSGNKLMAIMGNSIVEFNSSGDPTVDINNGATLGFDMPSFLNTDSDGNMYVSNYMGGDQKIFKITPAGSGAVLYQPADPTGIGATALKANGDFIFIGNGLRKLPHGGSVDEAYLPNLSTLLLDAFQVNNTIPGGAISANGKISSDSFAFDDSENIYTVGMISYLYNDNGWKQFSRYYIIKITALGAVELLEDLQNNGNASAFVWRGGHYYYLKFVLGVGIHIIRG